MFLIFAGLMYVVMMNELSFALPVGFGFMCALGLGFYCYHQGKMIQYLDDLSEVISLRKKAAGPSSAINIPKKLLDRMDVHNKERSTSSTGAHGSSGYSWYSDPSYYSEAAACG